MNSIKFNIIDWQQSDIEIEDDSENKGDNKEYIIELYGRTNLNDEHFPDKTVYLKVKNYYPHFYLRLPDNFNEYKLKVLVDYVREELYAKKYQVKNTSARFK